MKVAIYARVSTDEQTDLNQVMILDKWAFDRKWEVIGIYRDIGSAWTQKGDRSELSRLMADCQRGKVSTVLVYDLSRLTRKGPLEMLTTLKRFSDNGAQVYSYSETWLNVPAEFNSVLIAFYGYFAKLFSDQLSARTRAGMARARAQGVHVGRPRKNKLHYYISHLSFDSRQGYCGVRFGYLGGGSFVSDINYTTCPACIAEYHKREKGAEIIAPLLDVKPDENAK